MAYDLTARLRVRDENFSSTMRKATGETEKFKTAATGASSAVDRVGSANGRAGSSFMRLGNSANKALSGVTGSITSTIASIHGMGTAIVGAAAAFGTYKLGEAALQLSSDAEQAGIAFETMLGSGEKAQKFLGELTQFANATPFELPELRDASKRMLAFGFASEKIIPMLTGVGNAAAGLGLGGEGVTRITLALGQMQAKAKVSGDEMMQLTEAGIPAWQILADKMKISTAEVMKLSEKGVIPADKAIKVLIDGMNKRFPDMMSKQSKTLQGLWSTMKDTFDNKILVEFGNGIASALKPRFDAVVTWIDANGDAIKRWGDTIQQAVGSVADRLLTGFESAFKTLKSRYFDNPEFLQLDTKGKVSVIFDDIKQAFDTWYDAGGNKQLSDTTSALIGYLSDALSGSSAKLTKIGADLGKSIGAGMLTGLQGFAKENPIMSALLAFIATPGPLPVKFGAAVMVGGQGEMDGLMGKSTSTEERAAKGITNPFYREGGVRIPGTEKILKFSKDIKEYVDEAFPTPDQIQQNMIERSKHIDGSNAGGLDRVPYNGYISELHKDERVQTKAEADAMRNGAASRGGVTVTGNTFIVRQDSDIDAIAYSLARQLGVVAP